MKFHSPRPMSARCSAPNSMPGLPASAVCSTPTNGSTAGKVQKSLDTPRPQYLNATSITPRWRRRKMMYN